jgi:hypothetical protein
MTTAASAEAGEKRMNLIKKKTYNYGNISTTYN